MFTSIFRDVGAVPADARGPLLARGLRCLTQSLRAGELNRAVLQDLAARLGTAEEPYGRALLAVATGLAPRVRAYIQADLADAPDVLAEVLHRLDRITAQ